jgi:NADH-quinone oxidoreductase subunit E
MISFKQESLKKIDEILLRYPNKHGALMPVLDLAQEEFGYISDEVVNLVAKILDIEPIKVRETSTFYTMYSNDAIGKNHIQICHNISCSLRGAEELIKFLQNKFNIKVGETTLDKKFTLTEVECLGACGGAPCVQINEKYYENMNEERLEEIINKM